MVTKKEPLTVAEARVEEGLDPVHKNLVQKLAEAILEIGKVDPQGWNAFHKYAYYSDEQLSGLFRDKLASRNIVVIPSVRKYDIRDFETEKGKHSFLTTMTIDWEIRDGDSSETIVATTVGQGDDPGDKGANKAMTGAFKYFLIKMGFIGGGGDAEADERTDKRHSGSGRPQEASAAPRPTQAEKARVEVPSEPVEGVQKGGRQAGASEPQVDTVSRLAKELGIGIDGLVNVVKNVLGVEVEMPEDETARAPFIRLFFENLTSEEIGKVVQALQEAKDRQP